MYNAGIIIISYEQDSKWSSEFAERLKSKYADASLKILDHQDEDSLKEVLRNHQITVLFVVTDEKRDMQLLKSLECSPALAHCRTTIITGVEDAEEEKLGLYIDVLPKRSALETAERVLGQEQCTVAEVLSRTNRRNVNTSSTSREGKSKNKVKKSWPFRNSMPKLAQIEKKQHSSLKNVSEQMVLHDIHSKLFGIEKTLEHMRKSAKTLWLLN